MCGASGANAKSDLRPIYPTLSYHLASAATVLQMPKKIHGVRRKIVRRTQTLADGSTQPTRHEYWIADVSLPGLDSKGRRRRKLLYFKSQHEATEALRHHLVKYGTKRAPSFGKAQGLASFLKGWLDTVERDVAPTTARDYRGTIERHVLPHISDDLQLIDFDASAVDRLYTAARNGGASPAMIARVHRVLRIALNRAVRGKLIATSPLVGVTSPKHRSRVMEPLTPSQTRDLLAAAKGHRLEAVIVLAVTLGLRKGELFGLTWADCDLENRTLQVRRSVRDVGGTLSISTPKGGRYRSIELGALATAALRERAEIAM
jgi:hypothetical protein